MYTNFIKGNTLNAFDHPVENNKDDEDPFKFACVLM